MFIVILFFLFVLCIIYPIIGGNDNYYERQAYQDNERVFVKNMLRLQEINREIIKNEIMKELSSTARIE
jgi:hypothetical protein